MSDFVEIVEVGPRDGVQNEPAPIPTEDKIALINLLSAAGFRRIEATSFVSPKWVPQMGDAAAVMAGVGRPPGVAFMALTPNLRGYEAARAARVDWVAVFTAATESFCRANLNCSIAESLDRFRPVLEAATSDGVPVRGYVSVVTDCPYEGPVAPAAVARVVRALAALGCTEIALGETLGRARPETLAPMLKAVLVEMPAARLAGHFHDTAGHALDNIALALEMGLRVFDAAVGGLGGCPFAPGAPGNVATEKVLARLDGLGFSTGLDRTKVEAAADLAKRLRARARMAVFAQSNATW